MLTGKLSFSFIATCAATIFIQCAKGDDHTIQICEDYPFEDAEGKRGRSCEDYKVYKQCGGVAPAPLQGNENDCKFYAAYDLCCACKGGTLGDNNFSSVEGLEYSCDLNEFIEFGKNQKGDDEVREKVLPHCVLIGVVVVAIVWKGTQNVQTQNICT